MSVSKNEIYKMCSFEKCSGKMLGKNAREKCSGKMLGKMLAKKFLHHAIKTDTIKIGLSGKVYYTLLEPLYHSTERNRTPCCPTYTSAN